MSDSTTDDRRGRLVVISGPSGVGKTTIVKALRDRLGGVFSVSATTRAQTAQEDDGVDYFFRTKDEFQQMIDAGELLEYAQVFGSNWYGTPRKPVDEALEEGHLVLLEIDVQGALQVRECAGDVFMMFILPPNEQSLLDRLRGRGRDDEAAIKRRFDEATKEIALAKSSEAYDAFIINDDLEQAQNEACDLVRAHLV